MRGKLALVTGASRGLGRAIAIALGREGAEVIVNYANRLADAEKTVALIEEAGGVGVAMQADVTDERKVKRLVGGIVDRYGRCPDILINNATGPQPMLAIEESTWQTYQDQLDFFVKAPFLLVQAMLPNWKETRYGRVINIGSEVVQLGNPRFASYVSAKSAMVGMTRSWANEPGPYGITVNLLAPGWIPVERHEGAAVTELDAYTAGVPLGHMGEPSDIGAAAVFLASDAARFITGQCLAVNGGKTFGI